MGFLGNLFGEKKSNTEDDTGAALVFDCRYTEDSDAIEAALSEMEEAVSGGFTKTPQVTPLQGETKMMMEVNVRVKDRDEAMRLNQALITILKGRGLYSAE